MCVLTHPARLGFCPPGHLRASNPPFCRWTLVACSIQSLIRSWSGENSVNHWEGILQSGQEVKGLEGYDSFITWETRILNLITYVNG